MRPRSGCPKCDFTLPRHHVCTPAPPSSGLYCRVREPCPGDSSSPFLTRCPARFRPTIKPSTLLAAMSAPQYHPPAGNHSDESFLDVISLIQQDAYNFSDNLDPCLTLASWPAFKRRRCAPFFYQHHPSGSRIVPRQASFAPSKPRHSCSEENLLHAKSKGNLDGLLFSATDSLRCSSSLKITPPAFTAPALILHLAPSHSLLESAEVTVPLLLFFFFLFFFLFLPCRSHSIFLQFLMFSSLALLFFGCPPIGRRSRSWPLDVPFLLLFSLSLPPSL